MNSASSSCPSTPRSSNQMWALQVNGEIPRVPAKVGWEQLSQEKLEDIVRSGGSKTPRTAEVRDHEEIPEVDLEDDQTPSINMNPSLKTSPPSRLPTMKELNASLPYKLPYLQDGEVDLRPLVENLLPISAVQEDDTLWDPDSILAELQLKANEEKRKKKRNEVHGVQ